MSVAAAAPSEAPGFPDAPARRGAPTPDFGQGSPQGSDESAALARAARDASARTHVTHALDALASANFAFNAPTELELGKTAPIQLRLSLANSISQLKEELTAEGERLGGVVKVSDRVEARLSGMNFEINAISEETQPLGENDTVEWSWDVKPTEEGEQTLHLTMTAILTVDGKDMSRTVRTLDRKIAVHVSSMSRATTLLGKYWQWLMTAVFIPLFGWAVRKVRKPREAVLAAG